MAENEPKEFDKFILKRAFPDAEALFTGALKTLDEIKDTALVILDTNVLLVPFGVSSEVLGEISAIYKKLGAEGRLCVPGQVAREFARNRPEKLAELYKQLLDRKSRLPNAFGRHPLLESIPDYASVLDKERLAIEAAAAYGKALQSVVEIVQDWTWNDPVSQLYREVFASGVVVDPPIDRAKVEEDLRYRVANSLPPGYRDARKADGGVGDLLIWHTILEVAKERSVDVIFVSGDEKSDWWHRSGGTALYPRIELVEEFRHVTGGKSLHIVSLSELLALSGAAPEPVSELRETERAETEAETPDLSSKLDPELRAAVDSLPVNEKLVFLLTEIEGFTYKQTAEVLDIPVGTVGWRLHHARRAVQRFLAAREGQRGNVRFPDGERWDIRRGSVEFLAYTPSGAITCRISEEALEDYFGAQGSRDAIAVFRANRPKIEEIARTKLRAGELVDGDVSITTADFSAGGAL